MAPRRERQADRAGATAPVSGGQDMADVNFDEFTRARQAGQRPGQRDAAPARGRSMTNLVGAIASVALLGGAVFWGYQIAERKVNGIPVLKAEAGPMRVAPDNPGGEVTEHQGLSVNDVAAIGIATPLPDEIVLAPRPAELAVEDLPGLAPEPPTALVPPQVDTPPAQPLTVGRAAADPAQGAIAPAAPVATVTAQAIAMAEELAQGAAPLSDLGIEGALSEAMADAPVVPGGLGKSLVPQRRPAAIAARAPQVPVISQPAAQLAPEALPTGARVVQFGVFDSAEAADARWNALSSNYGELMVGKLRVIQTAESGGRTFYRLRAAGFADEADARRFCSALSAEGTECIPVEIR